MSPSRSAPTATRARPLWSRSSFAFSVLHTYTIVDAINDKNVLPFRVDYIKTIENDPDIDDKKVWDIDRERVFMAPERIELVTRYILDHFDQKTYRQGQNLPIQGAD